jgi:hypothetical protein
MIPAPVSTFLNKLDRGTMLFVLLGVIISLQLFGLLRQAPSGVSNQSVPTLPVTTNISNDIFSSQTATIRGKIMSINGNRLRVENNQKVNGEFEAGRALLINDNTSLTIASSSADLRKIQTNKAAVISLLYIEGKYIVTSITYQ